PSPPRRSSDLQRRQRPRLPEPLHVGEDLLGTCRRRRGGGGNVSRERLGLGDGHGAPAVARGPQGNSNAHQPSCCAAYVRDAWTDTRQATEARVLPLCNEWATLRACLSRNPESWSATTPTPSASARPGEVTPGGSPS